MRATGVTCFLATLISAPLDRFSACAKTLARSTEPALAGLHMEGPYISPEDGARGAHRREDISSPTLDDFRRRQEAAGGRIRLVTIAPEVPGALPLIEQLVKDGVRVAIGHTAGHAAASARRGDGWRDDVDASGQWLRADAAAASELSLGAAGRRRVGGWPDRGRAPPPGRRRSSPWCEPRRRRARFSSPMPRPRPGGRQATTCWAASACISTRPDVWRCRASRTWRGRRSRWIAPSATPCDSPACRWPTCCAMASTTPARYLGIKPRGRIHASWDQATSRFTVLRVDD